MLISFSSIDAVGFEARTPDGTAYNSSAVLDAAFETTRVFGGVGVLGVYYASDVSPGTQLAYLIPKELPIDFQNAFMKSLHFGRVGNVDVREVGRSVINTIASGKASPGYIVSSEINIHQAPEYYQRFSDWEETKVVIKF